MLSKFFLDRPVFAWVIAIVMMSAGGLAIYNLPISQYPPIAPPSIAIDSYFPGASAETVENTVTQIIEQKMTGLDSMLYLSGNSSSSGASRIELTFAPGTDPDIAWSKVQNKLQLALASLPDTVQRQGVKVSKSTKNYLMVVGLVSQDGSMSGRRPAGLRPVPTWRSFSPGCLAWEKWKPSGPSMPMRIWVNPDKLTNYRLTIADVIQALKAYNVEVSAGQFGGEPAVKGQRLNAAIIVQHLLQTPEEFAAIPIRTNPDGSVVRVKDIGWTELGTERYDIVAEYNGKSAAAMAIRQAAGANALDTANNVKHKMEEMSHYFPPGMKVIYPYDTTPFTQVAIDEVVKTLIEAVVLVFVIMYLFMGTFRATLIPTIAVPVVLLGTFAVLEFFGFSINMLTMFAMVLAIGLLVDDAIVVVENVERIMREEGLPPKAATAKSMDEITSALVGIGLVLSAVFGPMAFFPGSTGVIYRQFFGNSHRIHAAFGGSGSDPHSSALRHAFKADPQGARFFKSRDLLHAALFPLVRPRVLRIPGSVCKGGGARPGQKTALCVFVCAHSGGHGLSVPAHATGYLPDEDQGILMLQAILPPGATLEETQDVINRAKRHFLENEKEGVLSFLAVAGTSFGGQGQNVGLAFIKLKDWKLRQRPDLKVKAIAGRAMRAFSQIKGAMVFAFPPPSVMELGNATGFDFQLQDRGGLGHGKLMAARNQLLGMAARDPRLIRVRPNGMSDVPEYRIDIDWQKAGSMGVPISAIHNTISAAFGSAYVNDFIQAGRVKRVFIQADAPLPHAAQGYGQALCPQQRGQKWCRFLLSPPGTGPWALPSWNATTPSPPSTSGASRLRAGAPARPCRPWKSLSKNCPRGSAMTGPAFPIRSEWPAPRRLSCTRFRFSSFSFAWRPCTKVGPYPSPSC